ncbi:MAG: propionyl-coenzyme A carboxylase alpha polypeptide [Mesorhizobium sp.]|nr:MAG: propionyl-coenzyme A carboxylase alpha polypeptide [Mesorhizobium sp.]RWA81141.1 MAG: propionyl-coenzyme A carboxylase alpha polypeptide [Mesorhizobium sp.]
MAVALSEGWREAPPSALPGISPARGEIGSFGAASIFLTLKIGEGSEANNLPLAGEMAGRPEGGASRRTSN